MFMAGITIRGPYSWYPQAAQTGLLMDRPDSVNANHVDDSVLQISEAGHWFLEGWVGDHSAQFLVDSD